MKEEFNLSEKQEKLRQRLIEKHVNKYGLGIINDMFFQFRDLDKEFIRILLDTYEGTDENWIRKETIIKLAGEELKE